MSYILPNKTGYTIYTKKGCIFCDKAKELLKNEETHIISCDDYLTDNVEEFLNFITSINGGISYRTFPIIFYEGKFLGGFKETQKHYEMNKAFDDYGFA